MKHFKHNGEKQNIVETKNLHQNREDLSAGFSGGYKAIVLSCSALIITALISAAPIIGNKTTSESQIAYADIAIKANEKLKSSDYSEAIELFKQAIEINPNDEELYIGLAESYSGANENYMARETLETGYNETKSSHIKIKLDELNTSEEQAKEIEKLIEQGRSYMSNNDNEAALDIFLDVINRDQKYAEAYILAAEISDKEEAVKLLKKGYEITNDVSIKATLDKLTTIQNELSLPEKIEVSSDSSVSEESSNIIEKVNTVSVKNLTDENFQSYNDTEIFKGHAEWFELSSNENLSGVEKVNASISEILNKYFEFNLSVYGFENENNLLNLIKSNGKVLETEISARVTYNSGYVLSYTVEISIKSPEQSASSTILELHTIDLRTGNELNLVDILNTDESSIRKSVVEAFNSAGIEFAESEFDELKFYLENEKLVLIVPSGKTYLSLNNDKSKQTVSETEESDNISETR